MARCSVPVEPVVHLDVGAVGISHAHGPILSLHHVCYCDDGTAGGVWLSKVASAFFSAVRARNETKAGHAVLAAAMFMLNAAALK
jgi:hypothetical protein